MEICGGNLSHLLQKFKEEKKNLREELKVKLVIQILDVINMLHTKEIIHRNIKSTNLLISKNKVT